MTEHSGNLIVEILAQDPLTLLSVKFGEHFTGEAWATVSRLLLRLALGGKRVEKRGSGQVRVKAAPVRKVERHYSDLGRALAQECAKNRQPILRPHAGETTSVQALAAALSGGLPNLSPAAPVYAERRVAMPPAIEGKLIQKGTGRGIVALAGRADQRGRRGEQHEVVQRIIQRQAVQVPGPGNPG